MNIYVSNLDPRISEQELKKLFSQHGEVSSANVVTDYDSGASRGFAFVDMPNDQEGQRAISKLNHIEVNGQPISVEQARPREEKGRRSRPMGGQNAPGRP